MAIIDNKEDEYFIYKYTVHELYLLFNGENYKLETERLNSLAVLDHFLENLYPIIKIDLALEQSVYNRIIKEKDTLKVKINMRKYYRKNSDDEKSLESNYINDVFSLILDDTYSSLDSTTHELEYPEGDTNELNAVNITMELFLFKGDLIKSNTALVNNILKNVNVATGIGYMLSQTISSKVLMTKPDNHEIYEEFKIPPLKTSQAFAFIDSYYGIYNTGTIIYFGFDRGYIIPFCKPSNALEDGELDTVCIIIPNIGSDITDNICMVKKYSDTSKHYVIGDPSSFSPANRSVSGNIIDSEDVEIVENDTGSISKSSESNKTTEVLPSENQFYQQIYEATVKSNECVISVSFKDCDLSIFTPNKKYQFIFEDTSLSKQYKGTYYLCQLDVAFVKESKDLTGGAECVFRKSVV